MQVTVKAEVYRLHVYDEKQAAEIAADSEAASAAMEKAAAERAAKGQPSVRKVALAPAPAYHQSPPRDNLALNLRLALRFLRALSHTAPAHA